MGVDVTATLTFGCNVDQKKLANAIQAYARTQDVQSNSHGPSVPALYINHANKRKRHVSGSDLNNHRMGHSECKKQRMNSGEAIATNAYDDAALDATTKSSDMNNDKHRVDHVWTNELSHMAAVCFFLRDMQCAHDCFQTCGRMHNVDLHQYVKRAYIAFHTVTCARVESSHKQVISTMSLVSLPQPR
jgi:hypothetical protein